VALARSRKIMIDSDLVAKRYLPVRRDEPMLLPPDVREWLPADHVVWFLLDVVAALDTSVLHRRSRLGGAGRAPYDPDMLLAVLVYAYAGGLRSSRKIEKRCQEDAAFMVVSGLCRPDHVTIARFRQDNTDAMDDLFDQVLVLCVKAGLGNLEHVAIDGTKIAADASPAMSRDAGGLRGTGRRWLVEAARVDDEEDERFGGRRGDELPEELQDPAKRRRVIADLIEKAGSDPDPKRGRARQRKVRKGGQALELADELQAEAQTNAEVDLQRPMARLARAEAKLAQVRAQFQAQADDRARREEEAEGRICGPRPVPVEQQARVRQQVARVERDRQRLTERRNQVVEATGRRNLTDPDARFLPTQRDKFVLGYNAQLAVTADHLILVYDLVQDTGDVNQLIPMLARVEQAVLTLRTAVDNPDLAVGTALFDAGYASEDNLTAPGPNRLVALGKRDHIAGNTPPTSPPGPDATATQKMAWQLSTLEGKALYKKRGATVEPVNSHLKQPRGLRRFSRRGITAAKAELALAALTTNLMHWFTTRVAAAT
jgi:transposase